MLLIKNAIHLGTPVDLLINHEKIVTMTPAGHVEHNDVSETLDAQGLILLPAFIDCHVHLREPGFEYKENIDTGLQAASYGGFGAVMAMANTKPVNDNAAVTKFMLNQARTSHPAGPDLYPVAAATIDLQGAEISPLAELAEAGCIAVSNDGKPITSSEMVRRVMEYAADLGLKFIDHCEDPSLAKGWLLNEGKISAKLGVKGQPAMGEALQVARDVMLAETLNIPVHIAHVSAKLSVDIIRWAKERDIKVTAETCPHYLLLDETEALNYNPLAKVSPPLRTHEDQEALIEAIKTGVIDILVTDHAPHAADEKNTTLDLASFGMIGLELAIPLTFKLVQENILQEADLHRLWGLMPSEIFNIPYNSFNPGDMASFSLYDPDFEWKVCPEELHSKSHNTPFLGKKLHGKVKHQWLKGHKLF